MPSNAAANSDPACGATARWSGSRSTGTPSLPLGFALSYPWIVVYAVSVAGWLAVTSPAVLIATLAAAFASEDNSSTVFIVTILGVSAATTICLFVLGRKDRESASSVRLLQEVVFVMLAGASIPLVIDGVFGTNLASDPKTFDVRPGVFFMMFVAGIRRATRSTVKRMSRHNRERQDIAVFRSFDGRVSKSMRRDVILSLGAYGRVRLLVDDAMTLFGKLEFLGINFDEAFFNPSRVVRRTDADWRVGVHEILRTASFAVVDISIVSENVVWEIEQCLDSIPAERLLFVCSLGSRGGPLRTSDGRDLRDDSRLAKVKGPGTCAFPLRYDPLRLIFRPCLLGWLAWRRPWAQ